MKSLTKEIKELDNVHSTSAPAFVTVYNWMNEFKRNTSTCDACSIEAARGCPIEGVQLRLLHQKSSIKIYNIVLIDR